MSEEVIKRRPARYMAPESGIRPYSRVHAEGYKMLSELEKVCSTLSRVNIELNMCDEVTRRPPSLT